MIRRATARIFSGPATLLPPYFWTTMDIEVWGAGCGLRVVGCGAASCELRGCGLRVCGLRVAGCGLRVAGVPSAL